jgi:hypothetical protein
LGSQRALSGAITDCSGEASPSNVRAEGQRRAVISGEARSETDSRQGRLRVEGNARLTAGTAVVLLVLLAVEGVTVLQIHQLLTLHVVVGLLLVPPVLLKMASTTWRFAHYYRGDAAYREKGPPHPVLRVLGPFVVVLTVILFASGTALLLAPNGLGGRLLLIHKASFVLWLAVTAVHVLGHLVETGRLAPRDWMHHTRRRVPHAGVRQLSIAASLVIGAVLAVALVGHVNTYRQTYRGAGHDRGPNPPAATPPSANR